MQKENLEVLLFFAGFIFIATMIYLANSFLHATFNFIDWGFEGRKDAIVFFILSSFWWCICYVITKPIKS